VTLFNTHRKMRCPDAPCPNPGAVPCVTRYFPRAMPIPVTARINTANSNRFHACDPVIHVGQSMKSLIPVSGCSYAAKRADTLKQHHQTHDQAREFKCSRSNCDFRANSRGSMAHHMKKRHNSLYSTKDQRERDKDQPRLISYVRYVCDHAPICSFVTPDRETMANHMESHASQHVHKRRRRRRHHSTNVRETYENK